MSTQSNGDFIEFVLGGAAAASAAMITNPAEVVKTRFQLQGEQGNGLKPYRNVFQAVIAIGRHEGLTGLQRGLLASMSYQFVMNGSRFGSYKMLVDSGAIHKADGTVSMPRSVLCGAVCGAASAWIGNPLYLVKTRMQATSTAPHLAVGSQHHYRNVFVGLRHIYQATGVLSLWHGAHVSALRVSVGSAAQLSVFSKSKDIMARALRRPHESHLVSFLGSLAAGMPVVLVIHPFDLVCTRMFNQTSAGALGSHYYRGVVECFCSIMRTEGLRGFYGGFWAGYARLAPHTFFCLFFWDELRFLASRMSTSTPSLPTHPHKLPACTRTAAGSKSCKQASWN